MNIAWPRIPLSRALRQAEDVVFLVDDQEYRQVTVSLHGRGLRLRQIVKGADVKTKRQYRVRAGQFLYSRIDARNGAFGLVPSELDGAVVSNDFPVFDVEATVADPRFLAYLAQSRWFVPNAKTQVEASPIASACRRRFCCRWKFRCRRYPSSSG